MAELTRRERKVAALVAEGHTNRVMAEALGFSSTTAKWHVNQILQKLGYAAMCNWLSTLEIRCDVEKCDPEKYHGPGGPPMPMNSQTVHRRRRASGDLPRLLADDCGAAKPRVEWGAVAYPGVMMEILRLLLGTLASLACDRQDLLVENLLLRHQLLVARRSSPCPTLRTRDQVLWVLARRLCPAWRRLLVLVTPETVVRWHRQGGRLFWTWRSRERG